MDTWGHPQREQISTGCPATAYRCGDRCRAACTCGAPGRQRTGVTQAGGHIVCKILQIFISSRTSNIDHPGSDPRPAQPAQTCCRPALHRTPEFLTKSQEHRAVPPRRPTFSFRHWLQCTQMEPAGARLCVQTALESRKIWALQVVRTVQLVGKLAFGGVLHLRDQLRRLEGSEMSKGCTDLREEVAARSSASRKRVAMPLDTIKERAGALRLNVYRHEARRADKDSDRNNPERAERKGKGPQGPAVADAQIRYRYTRNHRDSISRDCLAMACVTIAAPQGGGNRTPR